MANKVIHIFGASGSGTTTLGKYICEHTDYFFMDTDDYFWMPTDPCYTTKRPKEERLARMYKELGRREKVVISGSLVDWGDELIPLFTFAIRVKTETDIRLARLRKREREHFGARIDVGGDMYENHCAFIRWAADYDNGGLDTRSSAKHDAWKKLLKCRLIELDGSEPLELNFARIRNDL